MGSFYAARSFIAATIAYNAIRAVWHASIGVHDVAIVNLIYMEVAIWALRRFDHKHFGPEP